MDIDQAKLREFVGKAIGDVVSALTAAPVVIGDALGSMRPWRKRVCWCQRRGGE
jgi:hypothetical protein